MPSATSPLQSTEIASVVRPAADAVTLKLKTYFPFKAGQSIAIVLPGDSKPRYYSLCSAPSENDHLAITIKTEPGHALAQIIPKLNVGDQVQIQGPLGKFSLPEHAEGQLIFIAGGSGVTPFRSMLKELDSQSSRLTRWLFHSVKQPADLFFRDEFTAWTQMDPAFHYVPTVTQGQDADWSFDTGRIGGELLRKHLTSLDGHFFLCGPRPFVKDMELLLTDTLKIHPDHIRREQW